MKTSEALKIVGGLSSLQMPGWAYGLPAAECKTGSKLARFWLVCSGCYALRLLCVSRGSGCTVQKTGAIRSRCGWCNGTINNKKSKEFGWHDSGDVQDEEHLLKILQLQSSRRRCSTGCQRGRHG